MMNPELQALIVLHDADNALRAAEALLARCPVDRAAIQSRLDQERARLDAARAATEVSSKARRKLEAEIQDLETKRTKYKSQQGEVKTNKEYQALLHEIENVEREIRGREDRALEEMEAGEAHAADVKREEAHFRATEAQYKAEFAEVDAREKAARQQVEVARADRDTALLGVPEAPLAQYQRIANLRGGVAMAEAKDGCCQACRVKMRPQQMLDLKKNEQVTQCPSCQRVLYFVPEPPTVDHGP